MLKQINRHTVERALAEIGAIQSRLKSLRAIIEAEMEPEPVRPQTKRTAVFAGRKCTIDYTTGKTTWEKRQPKADDKPQKPGNPAAGDKRHISPRQGKAGKGDNHGNS